MPNLRPKVEIKFKKWWEDYLDDIAKTGLRLLECGVSYEKVDKIINDSVKEIIPDAIEVKIDYGKED